MGLGPKKKPEASELRMTTAATAAMTYLARKAPSLHFLIFFMPKMSAMNTNGISGAAYWYAIECWGGNALIMLMTNAGSAGSRNTGAMKQMKATGNTSSKM